MLNIDTDYFNIIDTDEKAYILGLVYKNDNYIIKLSNRTDIKSILSNICLNIDRENDEEDFR